MFENVLHQNATVLLSDDIKNNTLPGSILFAGPSSQGKLTCALELARVLSCKNNGEWNCTCPSCQKNKALVSQNVLLAGPCERYMEISACADTLLNQNANNTRHLAASRFLFVRAVRKLTMRFSQILWEGEDKLSKFSPILATIMDDLEKIDVDRELPEDDELEKIVDEIVDCCEKLESSFLYKALPINQIRNISSWAHLGSSFGKKVVILENADRMAEGARNALLKILEEPPEDTVFILTTSNRGAMLQTILSRVRTYHFTDRTPTQQKEVVERVFHYMPPIGTEVPSSIEVFLENHLDITPDTVKFYAETYFNAVCQGHIPDMSIVCKGFTALSSRVVFKRFMQMLIEMQGKLASSPRGAECSVQLVREIHETYNNVNVYNQNPQAALEALARKIMQLNNLNDGVLRETFVSQD